MPRKTKAQLAAEAAEQNESAGAAAEAESASPTEDPAAALPEAYDAVNYPPGVTREAGTDDDMSSDYSLLDEAEPGVLSVENENDGGESDTVGDGSDDDEPDPQDLSPDTGKEKAVSPMASFFQIDFKEMDKELSPEQLQEWQTIYASFRSRSIITGVVSGVDSNAFLVTDKDTGLRERRVIQSLVIIGYRVKILIPETELWDVGETRPGFVARAMIGAKVSYVIMDVDRAGECAIASRRMALRKQQRRFRTLYGERPGAHVSCNVIAVGAKRCLVECGGYDLTLTQRDLSYTAIADLRREYHPGQQLQAVFKGFSPETRLPDISVKEMNPNPFDGAELRHPVGSRRQAIINGKYAGGVFCVMPDGVTCLCLYSNNHFDAEFSIGERVLLHITQYDYKHKLIYARIITKW